MTRPRDAGRTQPHPADGGSPRFGRRRFLKAAGMGTAGAALLPLAAACGGGAAGASGSLTFSYWGTNFEQQAVAKMLQTFSSTHQGVNVQPLFVTGDYDTKIQTLVAAGNAPDMGYMDSLQWELATSGKLVNMFPYYSKYAELGDRLPSTYFWWAPGKSLGTQTAAEVMLLWYEKDLTAKAGVNPPAVASQAWSMDQLVAAAEKMTFDDNGNRPSQPGFNPKKVRQYGISAEPTNWQAWYPLVKSNGGDVTDPTGTTFTLNQQPAVQVLQDLQDLIYKHRVAPTPAAMGTNAPTTAVQLQTKQVAMIIDGQWNLLDMWQTPNLSYGMGVLPQYAKPTTMQLGGASVIFSSTKHLSDTVELYLYHNDPQHVDLFRNGLWMPLEKKYYTDEKYISQWTGNSMHPPEFRTAVVDYTLNNSVGDYHRWLKNQLKFDQTLLPALQVIAAGTQPAKEVLDAVATKIQPLLQGAYPTPATI